MEIFYCYACNRNQPKYFEIKDDDSEEITICKSFAEKMWGGDITKPSTIFDQCGMLLSGSNANEQYELPSAVSCLLL